MAKSRQSSVQDKIGDMTTCSICTEIFTNPKILPCVHTFCLHCLETYGKDKKPGDQITCPVCRNEFAIPNGGLCNLPNNFFIGNIVEVGKMAVAPMTEAMCNICPEGEELVGKTYCIDCEQMLCERCSKSHKKTKFSQNHQIVELGSGLGTREFNLLNSYCEHHPKELVKMYCTEHRVAICLICCVESHQSHRCTCINVEKAAGGFTERLKEDLKKVTSRLPECEEVGRNLDVYKKEFLEEISTSEKKIRDTGTKLKLLIDEHTEELLQNLKLVTEKTLKAVEMTKQDVERFKVMIDSYTRYSDELLSRGSPVDVCRATDQMHERANELEKLPANCSGDRFCCDTVAFQPSSFDNLLNQCKSNNAVGDLTVIESPYRIIKFEFESTENASSVWLQQWDKMKETKRAYFGESLESSEDAEDECRTVEVHGVDSLEVAELLLAFMENRRRGGGTIESESLDENSGVFTLKFEDKKVTDHFLVQKSISMDGKSYNIRAPVKEVPKTGSIPPEELEEDPFKDREVEERSRTVEVHNVPSQEVAETIVAVLENKRRGGGTIEDFFLKESDGILTVRFQDKKFVKTLIQQQVLIHKGNQLVITAAAEEPSESAKPDEASSVSCRMVDVRDIPRNMTTDELMMLLENSSGGDVESIDHDQNSNTAVVTFIDSVAADVLICEESVFYRGKRLSVTRHVEKKVAEMKHIPIEKREKPSSSNRTIFVSQIPRPIAKDFLVMLLESKRVGGGKTEDVDFNPEQRTAVVTFEDPKIAASFLKKELIEFKGEWMLVTKHVDQDADTGRGEVSDDNTSAKKTLYSPRNVVSGSFNTVKVCGLKGTSKEMISMYFENNKRSGGGKLKVLDHQKEKGKIVIMFENPEDALEVCRRSHNLSGVTPTISALEMPLDDVKSCAIEVKGLGQSATENFLELHFENARRSGGGPVETVFLNKEARTAIVVFEDATAVLGVMKRKPHTLDGANLEVSVLEAAPPPPLLLSGVNTNRLLAKRLPPSVTRESLCEYLGPAAKAKMVYWTLVVKHSTALLDFSSEPDYLSIRRLVCSKPFLGKMISIRRVSKTANITLLLEA